MSRIARQVGRLSREVGTPDHSRSANLDSRPTLRPEASGLLNYYNILLNQCCVVACGDDTGDNIDALFLLQRVQYADNIV